MAALVSRRPPRFTVASFCRSRAFSTCRLAVRRIDRGEASCREPVRDRASTPSSKQEHEGPDSTESDVTGNVQAILTLRTLLTWTLLLTMLVSVSSIDFCRCSPRDLDVRQLKTQLTQALDHSTLPDDALAAHLLNLQKEIVSLLANTAEP